MLFTKRHSAKNKGWTRSTDDRLNAVKKGRKIQMIQQGLSIPSLQKDGEVAAMHSYLDEGKIESEAQYDGLVCRLHGSTFDDEVSDILKVSEGRWQIEECFRIMKTDFFCTTNLSSRWKIVSRLIFSFAFFHSYPYRMLEKKLDFNYSCESILRYIKGNELGRDCTTRLYSSIQTR